jgi:hypothetical protein
MSARLAILALVFTVVGCGNDDAGGSLVGQDCTAHADCGPGGRCLGLADGATTGVCTVPASGPCADDGSRGECPTGSRCWKAKSGDYMCWADCPSNCGSAGVCDDDGSCVARTPVHSQCSCSCTCNYCSATSMRTCSGGGAGCSSCSAVCREVCGDNPSCGGYVSGGGTCS